MMGPCSAIHTCGVSPPGACCPLLVPLQVKQGAIAISLIKGMRVRTDGPQLISQMVNR